jgi:hypothetical protein
MSKDADAFRVVITLPRHCSDADARELMNEVERVIQPHSVHVESPPSSVALDDADARAERFTSLLNDATRSLEALSAFWTKLYGPNEALADAFDSLEALDVEWNTPNDEATSLAFFIDGKNQAADASAKLDTFSVPHTIRQWDGSTYRIDVLSEHEDVVAKVLR